MDYDRGLLSFPGKNPFPEVVYEYYRNSRDRFHMAGIGFGPSDRMLVEVNGYAFDESTSDTHSPQTRGFDVLGEFRWRLKGLDFKLTPEFAGNQTGSQKGKSIHLRTDVSSKNVRLFSEFERYDGDFKKLFPRRFPGISCRN